MAAYDGKIWFGNARNARWVKAPLAEMGASAIGNAEEQQFTNGGQFVKASFGSARNFEMSWVGDRADLQVIKDFKDGLYGGGLIYWEDPFADNILPPHWAAPMLTVRDWPSLISSGNKPEPISHTTNPNNFPFQSAKYPVTNTAETSRSLTLLIPEGHSLSIGFVYSKTGTAAIRAVKVNPDGTDGATVVLGELSASTGSRYSDTFSNEEGNPNRVRAIRVYISRTDNTSSTITIRGGMAKLAAIGGSHHHQPIDVSGPWSSGEGFTGCTIAGAPQMNYKGVVDGRRLITMSVSLKEIGAWL
jgi:hypothetical protein